MDSTLKGTKESLKYQKKYEQLLLKSFKLEIKNEIIEKSNHKELKASTFQNLHKYGKTTANKVR